LIRTGYSRRSFPLRDKVWAWGWRSAGPSSNPTAGGCGRNRTRRAAPASPSPCRSRGLPMTTPRHRLVAAIVDDDPRLLESLEELFESAGYEAYTFASAAGLLQRGLAGLSVLVTDIGMPGMDGFALRDLVRQA